jgi:hypothetical protein
MPRINNHIISWRFGCAGKIVESTLRIVVYFTTLFQLRRLYSVEWKGDNWIMKLNGFGKKRSWPIFKVLYRHSSELEKPRKTSVRTAGLQARIWTRDVPKYESGMSTTRTRRSVTLRGMCHCWVAVVAGVKCEQFMTAQRQRRSIAYKV